MLFVMIEKKNKRTSYLAADAAERSCLFWRFAAAKVFLKHVLKFTLSNTSGFESWSPDDFDDVKLILGQI